MERLTQKLLSYILIVCLMVALLPLSAIAEFPPYPPEALISIDPDVEMASQKEWMDRTENLKYEISHNDFMFKDFMYESNWQVSIDGKRSDNITKNIMLMRPRDNGGLGRTFVKPSDLFEWGKNLNGNPDYVVKTANAEYLTPIINNLSGIEVAKRVYIRDLARTAGAEVKGKEELNMFGEALLELGRVIITTTPFPKAVLNLPSTGTANTPVSITYSGEEFYPSGEYKIMPFIKAEVKVDGTTIKTGKGNYKTFTNSVTHTFPADGTYEVELLVSDQVERTTTVKKTIKIGSGGNPGGGGTCSREISPPSQGSSDTTVKLEADTSGVIKADARGNEQFDVLQGIPTSESLYTNAFAKEYVFQHTFSNMTGDVTYTVPVTKTYTLTWTEETPGPPAKPGGPPTVISTPKTETEEVTKEYTVKRPYAYWQIDNLEVYGLQQANMDNYALPNGSVSMSPSGYSAPTVSANNDDDVEKHVFPSDCNEVTLTGSVSGGKTKPPVPSEDFQSNAEGAVGRNQVQNDSVTFNGKTIMSDSKVNDSAPAPSVIPEAPMTNSDVFYESGLMISSSKTNQANTSSSGNVEYNQIEGIKGGSGTLTYPINGINTVTVHTPTVIYANVSDDKEHNQRTSPAVSKQAVILDRPFTIYMPTNGQHVNYPGYGNRDYSKYIKKKEVRFPFDVYHYQGGTKGAFVPANTWIDIPVAELQSQFYLPVWVNETPSSGYDVLFRSIAENSPSSGFTTQPNANTDLTHHVATDVIPVDVIGRVYDFRVTDIADYNWESVFRVRKNDFRHKGNYYWTENKEIDGALRGNQKPYVLPIMPGSHPTYKNVAVKTGYHFKFDLKTKGNMFNIDDGVRITPTFYFVNKDGSNKRKVDLYYHTDEKKFIKIGSPDDKEKRYVILNDRLRNVPQDHIINSADYVFDNYPGVSTTIKSRFIQDYLDETKKKAWVGKFDWMILPYKAKTHIGPSIIPNNASANQQRAIASIQQWYGEYSIPAKVYVVPESTNIAEYGRVNKLTDKSPLFLKNGYIIVNFNIETIRNKDLANPHLQYIHTAYQSQGFQNQWKREGYQNNVKDPYGHPFNLSDGDVVFYHGDLSSLNDFKSNVTH